MYGGYTAQVYVRVQLGKAVHGSEAAAASSQPARQWSGEAGLCLMVY